MKHIFISIGSSIGKSTEIFASAETWLNKKEIHILNKSAIHQTKPFGGVAQNIFSNAVWEIQLKNTLSQSTHPKTDRLKYLFDILKECEVAHGRDLSAPRWSDRELDLDILMMGDLIGTFKYDEHIHHNKEEKQTTELTLPHTEIAKRDFVLIPWAEIVPTNFIIPKFGSLKNLIEDLK
jgi:2-amino-4-hydroxy-6-hydroxymethyldihydropteridine diphosphokinase